MNNVQARLINGGESVVWSTLTACAMVLEHAVVRACVEAHEVTRRLWKVLAAQRRAGDGGATDTI